MRLTRIGTLFLLGWSTLLMTSVTAQSRIVKIRRFEVDGKPVHKQFKVLLYIDGKVIKPVRIGNGFIVPSEVDHHGNIGVRFISERYNLFFQPVDNSKFDTDWIVGVDNKPFDEENTASQDADPRQQELVGIYYLEFLSKKGLDTRMVVKEYK